MIQKRLKKLAVSLGYFSKPKFLIIGTQKGGTTSLYRLLNMHKNIKGAYAKEVSFFDQNGLYQKGTIWYHAQFPLPYKIGIHGVTFEATPEYLYYPQSVERVYNYNPDIILVVLLRNPIERAYSAWNMFRHINQERQRFEHIFTKYDPEVVEAMSSFIYGEKFPEFEDAIKYELNLNYLSPEPIEPSFIRRGIYDKQIARYLKLFKREQLLIFESETLNQNPGKVLRKILSSIEIKDDEELNKAYVREHVGVYESAISEKVRDMLQEFYQPFNENLSNILDYEFKWS